MSLPSRRAPRNANPEMPMPTGSTNANRASTPRPDDMQMPLPDWPAGVTPPPRRYSDVNAVIASDGDANVQRNRTMPQKANKRPSEPATNNGGTPRHDDDHRRVQTPSSQSQGNRRAPAKRGRPQVHRYDSERYMNDGRSGVNASHNGPVQRRNHDERDEYGRPVYNEYGYRIQWYPGYTGTDYPKGLGHGPRVKRRNIRRNKTIEYEGIAWEELPEEFQMRADREPYDDAGVLRVFYRGDAGYIYDYGSEEHAEKMKRDLKSRIGDFLNESGCISGYKDRPQKDKGADYLK